MTDTPNRPKVFISYARDDAVTVGEIHDFLRDNGCDPWIDTESLFPGQRWKKEVEDAIQKYDYFVICLSNNFIEGREGFRWQELNKALSRAEKFRPKEVFIIPILLEECEVPDPLTEFQWCQWYVTSEKEKLLASMKIRIQRFKDKPRENLPKNLIIPLPNLPKDAKPLELVLIPQGEFMMGSPENEKDRWDGEGPQHLVTINYEFYMGKYPITQAQWQAVMGDNPSYFKDNPNNPVERVTWYDCKTFLQKVNEIKEIQDVLHGKPLRLPSEAEWEYACRANTQTRFYWGDDLEYQEIDQYAWHKNNSENRTHEVGIKKPNQWDLHDMSGNVWEWCEDDWHKNYEKAPDDGRAWIDEERGERRVLRGGGWGSGLRYCRSAYRYRSNRNGSNNVYGFRVTRTP